MIKEKEVDGRGISYGKNYSKGKENNCVWINKIRIFKLIKISKPWQLNFKIIRIIEIEKKDRRGGGGNKSNRNQRGNSKKGTLKK